MALATEASRPAHRSFRLTQPAWPASLGAPSFLLAWGAYSFLSAVDCLTTIVAMAHHLRESNPLAAGLYALGGGITLCAFKLAVLVVMLPLLARLPRRLAVGVTAALAVVMAVNDASNLAWIMAAA